MDRGTPVTCRPAWWIRWLWPVAVLTFGAGALTSALDDRWGPAVVYGLLALVFVVHGVTTVRQVLTVDAVGLRGHTGTRRVDLPWQDVAVLHVPRRGTLGHLVIVEGHDGARVTLQPHLPKACEELLLEVACDAARDRGVEVRSART